MSLTVPQTSALPPFVPPPRFGETSFASYRPQHSSQQTALEQVQAFVGKLSQPAASSFRWPWQQQRVPDGRGLYLDGGFGVGKTHLLAAAFHACDLPERAYLSFQELVYAVGVKGMAAAKAELGGVRFFCIDEFELDDPGNTLIVKSFLAYVFAQGGSVLTTSNTPPEAQGQGRFNAGDFQREIQSVAASFTVVSLEGPDYRRRDQLAALFSEGTLLELHASETGLEPKHLLTWPELLSLLAQVHPIRYRDLIGQFGVLHVTGAQTLLTQNDALRFVHFVDKLYDLKKGLRVSGEVALVDLFSPSYRDGAYAKKHYRCLSRLSELLEAPAQTATV